MNRPVTLVVAFLVTFATVTAGAAVAGFATADGAAPSPEIENDHYLEEDLTNDGTPGEADVTMSSDVPSQTVVVDPGIEAGGSSGLGLLGLLGFGGPDVADRDIRPLANVLIENGHDVRVYAPDADRRPSPDSADDEPTALGEELAEADAFVTFRTDYTDEELEEIESFVEGDGHLVLATEPGATFEQPGPASLDATLDVTTGTGYVYNMAENDLNYQRVYAEPDADSELTADVDRAVFPTATPVGVAEGSAELRPIAGSELSTTRAATDDPLLVRDDGVVMVGDADFLSPENAQRADNDALIGNLADFLVTNERTPARQPPNTEDTAGPTGPSGPTQPDRPTGNATSSGGSAAETAP